MSNEIIKAFPNGKAQTEDKAELRQPLNSALFLRLSKTIQKSEKKVKSGNIIEWSSWFLRFFHRIIARFLRFKHAKVSSTFISIRACPIIFVYLNPWNSFAVPKSRSMVSFLLWQKFSKVLGVALKKLFSKSFLRIFKNFDQPKTLFSVGFSLHLLRRVCRQNLRCLLSKVFAGFRELFSKSSL